MIFEVPDDWWQEACEVVNHPMACVGTDCKFIWVNAAFEKLVGYSRSELRKKTYMEITLDEDVGGDLASTQDLLQGKDTQYTIGKRYRHKFGKVIPIELTVWAYPRHAEAQVLCFIAEAMPELANQMELEELKASLLKAHEALDVRMQLMEEAQKKGIQVNYNSQNADRGGQNSMNSTNIIMIVAIALCIAFAGITALVLNGNISIGTPQGTIDVNGQPNNTPPPVNADP